MEIFTKIVKTFAKKCILDIWLSSEYASDIPNAVSPDIHKNSQGTVFDLGISCQISFIRKLLQRLKNMLDNYKFYLGQISK